MGATQNLRFNAVILSNGKGSSIPNTGSPGRGKAICAPRGRPIARSSRSGRRERRTRPQPTLILFQRHFEQHEVRARDDASAARPCPERGCARVTKRECCASPLHPSNKAAQTVRLRQPVRPVTRLQTGRPYGSQTKRSEPVLQPASMMTVAQARILKTHPARHPYKCVNQRAQSRRSQAAAA